MALHDDLVPHVTLLALLLTAATVPTSSVQTRPAGQFRQPAETVETNPARQTDILEAVLRFYRPFGAQSRWIDREVLPSSADATPVILAKEVVDSLLDRLGRGRFCATESREDCKFRQGGRLRVTAPYLTDPTHARVVVEFESVWPYGPSIVTSQQIWLVHDSRGWRIERRADPA
jgi:hypothetical protein